MRKTIIAAFLLVLGAISLDAQDVVVSGNGDFKRLCEGNTLPAEEGWTVVKKNVAIPGVTPEIWCGIARIRKAEKNYIATLAYGPIRCDDMWRLSEGLVVFNKGNKYSALCLVDGKWKQTLSGYNCRIIACGHADGAKAQMLVRDKNGFFSWIDQGGKHIEGTPEHYEDAIIYRAHGDVVAVKTGGKWGAMSADARVVVPIQYDTLFLTAPLRQWGGKWADANWLYVNKDGLWGVRGDNGAEALPPVYGGLSYWPTAPDTWCYRRPGGKWGMMESSGASVLPEEYDGLSPYSFNSYVSGDRRLPFAIVARRGRGRALLNHKGKELLPYMEDDDIFDMMVMFYPRNSFSVFAWNRYKLWAKGEFESQADFEARRKDPSMTAGYISSLIPAAERAFISAIIGKDAKLILSRYDAESETFVFSIDKILQDTYSIKVPRSDAALFREDFESISQDALASAKYFIHNDMLSLGSISFTTPEGKTFRFVNPVAKGYALPSLKDLDLIR
ncbi:MAG: hypothetical protein J6Y31_06365 [Bacteroidales bacterium]|nr:hypothetical protein [Bacteroidales bacterium]